MRTLAVVLGVFCSSALFAQVSPFAPLDEGAKPVAETVIVSDRASAENSVSSAIIQLPCGEWAAKAKQLQEPTTPSAACKAAFESLTSVNACDRPQLATIEMMIVAECGYRFPPPAPPERIAFDRAVRSANNAGTLAAASSEFTKSFGRFAMVQPSIDAYFADSRSASTGSASTSAPADVDPPATAKGASGMVPLTLEASLINGFADFIATRAQLELLNWIANDFATKLCSGDSALRFRNTCRVLLQDQSTATKPIDFRQLGSAFQSALSRDLDSFVEIEIRSALRPPPGLEAELNDAFAARDEAADPERHCRTREGGAAGMGCA